MTRRPPRSSRPYTPCPYTPLFRSLPNDTLVGLDLGMSLPYADAGAFFPSWIESPADARSLWAMVDGICESDPYLEAGSFVDHARASAYFRRHGAREGARFHLPGAAHRRGRMRVTEEIGRAHV